MKTTESTKHTPGPWRIDKVWGLILAEKQTEVCAIHAGIAPDSKRARQDVAQANARLIAAAPELLEALKALLAECESRFDGVEATPEEDGAMFDAQTAIAEAEGRGE